MTITRKEYQDTRTITHKEYQGYKDNNTQGVLGVQGQ